SGFTEDLFSAMPRLVHSLDLAAEDSDSDAYRDLLREIDRAFQSFDHMAVRDGWMGSGPALDTPLVEMPSGIDLAAFVASMLPASQRVPAEWHAELDGLPGFDHASGTVRLTDDPFRIRDRHGRRLLYPGRSHPLTRRVITAARNGQAGRVSAARGSALSLLITYMAEIGDHSGTLFRKLFALLLFPDGSIQEQTDFLATAGFAVLPDRLWHKRFASWAPGAMDAAKARAAVVASDIAGEFSISYREKLDRDAATLRAWVDQRTNELCGPPSDLVGDLFATGQTTDDWRRALPSEQRLAALAADTSVAALRRREAAEILARIGSITANRLPLPEPNVRTLGMLMLVP
ncbi:MAG: hypothetical protein ACJ8AW_46370, partial [Rhodopila sp.]